MRLGAARYDRVVRASVLVVLIAGCGRVAFDALPDGATDPAPPFIDAFDRVDSTSLGNSWIEKSFGTYEIASQHVARRNFAGDYRDLIAVRPAEEDLLDVELSIDFTVGNIPPGYPQIHARVQRSTIATANTLDGYLLYVNGTAGNGVMFGNVTRQHGSILPPPLATFTISPELALGQTYRLRLAVRGASPVQLDGFVEHQAGSSWTVIGSVSMVDTDVTAVAAPGAIGFDAGQPEAAGYYTYDNFTYTSL